MKYHTGERIINFVDMIDQFKWYLRNETNIDVLNEFQEHLAELMNFTEQQKSHVQSYDDKEITVIRYVDFYGRFLVEKGKKSEYETKGYFSNRELLEEVECKRKGTKKYYIILNELKNKYSNAQVSA